MLDKFRNKYRISSARASWWDYGNDARYFVTICTNNRSHYFGAIEHDKMNLSAIGIIADILWFEIKHHAKNIELHEFVVMPNHIHGILELNGNQNNFIVETRHALSLQLQQPQTTNQDKTNLHFRFQNQGKNTLSSIIGSYKSAVTKHARRLGYEFSWQSRFHDHIIRNNEEYQRIANYIKNNPINWNLDKFCTE